MTRRNGCLLVAGALVVAASASVASVAPVAPVARAEGDARGQPYVFPREDVAVTYRSGPTGAITQTMRVAVSLGRQRVDAPGGGMSIITDLVARTMTVLDPAHRTYAVLPAPPGTSDMRDRPAPGGYARIGTSVVAGLACTMWLTHGPDAAPVDVCLTADGILLSAGHGDVTLARATRVDRTAQDPALFRPPAGYTQVASR